MSADRGATDRPPLEGLVHRARAELRDWTDTADSDPGVAMLQLFALVGELLSSHSERLAAEAYLGSPRRGRSTGRHDEPEDPARASGGLHRATVLDNADPLEQRRLLVRVPDVSADESVWAAACLPVGDAEQVPAIGDGVWIALESGDPSRPIWLGQRLIS